MRLEGNRPILDEKIGTVPLACVRQDDHGSLDHLQRTHTTATAIGHEHPRNCRLLLRNNLPVLPLHLDDGDGTSLLDGFDVVSRQEFGVLGLAGGISLLQEDGTLPEGLRGGECGDMHRRGGGSGGGSVRRRVRAREDV